MAVEIGILLSRCKVYIFSAPAKLKMTSHMATFLDISQTNSSSLVRKMNTCFKKLEMLSSKIGFES